MSSQETSSTTCNRTHQTAITLLRVLWFSLVETWLALIWWRRRLLLLITYENHRQNQLRVCYNVLLSLLARHPVQVSMLGLFMATEQLLASFLKEM
jgi:hypothetical protein